MPADHPFTDARRGERLHKVLAEAGVASRRACEQLITSGAVAVNATPITSLPAWVDPARDRITVNGKRIKTSPRHLYIILFKPKGVICTNADSQGRPRAIDLVNHPSGARLFAVGRLDVDSSGLLLLTNDGDLANRITHPRYHMPKVYEVTVKGSLDAESVKKLEKGLFLLDPKERRGSRTARSRLKLIKRDRDRTRLLMELREGRNRQVRRMMVRAGHPVKKLRRIQLGPLRLKGLRVGEWRQLTARELAVLKRAAYGKVSAAGARSRAASG
ncbi:MAG: rRNA pseudouridine synthase [Planctomycetes bacterium]|nr:rRNA pseudouridine synthase [Planctomycetota bacterium]